MKEINGVDFVKYMMKNGIVDDVPEKVSNFSPFVKSWLIDEEIASVEEVDEVLENIDYKKFEREINVFLTLFG